MVKLVAQVNGMLFVILTFCLLYLLTHYFFIYTDNDECTSPNACNVNAQCLNTAGSYACQCALGYSGDGHSACTGNDNFNEQNCANISMLCYFS